MSDLSSPADFGPIYAETIMGRFPVEPWNTGSNLIFLFTVIYFLHKLIRDRLSSPIFFVGLPILMAGFVGGSLYHATRARPLWLYMDFIPILTLTMLASYYFWARIVGNKLWALLVCLGPFVVIRIMRTTVFFPDFVPLSFRISFGYTSLAILVLLPAVLYSRKHSWRGLWLLIGGGASFAVAIYFRTIDKQQLLPMGTHFLWHLLGGVSSLLLMKFLYGAELDRLRPNLESKQSIS